MICITSFVTNEFFITFYLYPAQTSFYSCLQHHKHTEKLSPWGSGCSTVEWRKKTFSKKLWCNKCTKGEWILYTMTTRANKRKILDEIRKNDPCADNCFQVYIWCDMKCAFVRSVLLLPRYTLFRMFDVLLDTKLEHLMSINGVLCSWKIKGVEDKYCESLVHV